MIVNHIFRFGGGLLAGAVPGSNATAAVVIPQVFAIAAEVLVMPIGAASSILLYYDLRIRKEGFDLEMLAQSLGLETGATDEQAQIQ
jgi:hypothetical protein